MPLIEIQQLTKDYGQGRGIFDVNLTIEKGEAFGFVGTNGAGKTTLIRHLMGFLKPQNGSAAIQGLDCWKDAAETKKAIGYIAGEIAFPSARTGTEFLALQAELLGLADMSYAEELIQRLQLDPTANLKRMSKGMKQKTAIVASLMGNPDILILDEPTTGLDPLMRAEFIDILQEEKKKGKTIFMSSHMFDEVESICDKVSLIKDGHLIATIATQEITHNQEKVYKVEFATKEDFEHFTQEAFAFLEKRNTQNQVILTIHDREINRLFQALARYDLKFITEIKYSLEQYFDSLYES